MDAKSDESEVAWQRAMLAALQQLAGETEVAALTRAVEEFLLDHVGERASLLIHDHEAQMLWSAIDDRREVQAGRGLIGHALATGEALAVARVERDARFIAASDDSEGEGRGYLLVQPVVGPASGELLAVLTVAGDHDPRLGERQAKLASFAQHFAPFFAMLALRVELDQAEELELAADTQPSLYRPEAVAAHAATAHGEVVRLSSRALAWLTWSLVALVALALVYMGVVEIGQYASGPALVRLGGRTEVSAHERGSVVEVLVQPGELVEPEQPLVRFHDVDDAAELRRIEQEFELQLRNLLREPGDAAAQREVASLRAQKQRASAQAQEHLVRAPVGGRVRDVRVRPGQALDPGDVLISIDGEDAQPQVIALLPGDERPRIEPGMTLSFELAGYPDATSSLIVERVADDVVSSSEALRLLGPAVAEGLELDESVILVHARLPNEGFESKRERYRWHEGMRGVAEVRVRETSILEALLPVLEEL